MKGHEMKKKEMMVDGVGWTCMWASMHVVLAYKNFNMKTRIRNVIGRYLIKPYLVVLKM